MIEESQPVPHFSGKMPFERELKRMEPFPIDCLPEPVQRYVSAHARAVDCDEASVALPVLSALAASIGGTRRIRLKKAWTEPAVLWTAIIGNAFTDKGQGIDAAVRPLEQRQTRAFLLHHQQMEEFKKACKEKPYMGTDGQRVYPERPPEPIMDRFIARESNVKTVIDVLASQPRGVLATYEELDGWIGRPNSSGSRRSQEVANWIDMYHGRSLTVELRKRVIQIPQASVSLTGTLEAETLMQKLLKSRMPCGLTSRLLFAKPESAPKIWTDDDVDEPLMQAYTSVVDKLLSLRFDKLPEPEPELPPGALSYVAAASPLPNSENEAAKEQRPGSGVRNSDLADEVCLPRNPAQSAKSEFRTPDPGGEDEPKEPEYIWKDPAETILMIFKGPRYSGSGEAKDVPYPYGPWRPPGTVPEQPGSAEKEFYDLVSMIETMNKADRKRLEIWAFGAGFGKGRPGDDYCELMYALKRYMDRFERVDPRPGKAPETTGLASSKSAELAASLTPYLVEVSQPAKELFGRFMNEIHTEHWEVDEALTAWFKNLAGHTARLALVLHLARWASGESVDPTICDKVSMERGITLATWFANEAQRVLAVLSVDSKQQEEFRLIDWLFRRGGVASTRDLCRSNGRKYRTSDAAEEILDKLAKTGVGVWVDIPPGEQGGAPHRVLSMAQNWLEQATNEGRLKQDGDGVTCDRVTRSVLTRDAEESSDAVVIQTVPEPTPAKETRPAGQRWTIEELVADDPREKLEKEPKETKETRNSERGTRNRKKKN